MIGQRDSGNGGGGTSPDIDLSGYVSMNYLLGLKWWGQSLDNGVVVGAMTGVAGITMTGAISGTTNITMTGMLTGATNVSTQKVTIGGFEVEYDSGNNALKFNGNIYATGGVTALGQGSGGGGGSTALVDLVDVAISNPTNGQVLKYNATTGKWYNGTDQGVTSLDWSAITNKPDTATRWPSFSEVTSKPMTLSGYGITDAKIANGVITLGSNTITPLTSVAFSDLTTHPTTLSGYGITDAKIANGTITLGANSITPLTSSDILDMATKTWVNQQGFVTSSGVTSVATGTGLTGGTITGSGTISINSTYQTYISNGNTAYGWGDHAQAGYLKSSDISDMATKTWVNQQGFVTSSGVTSVATGTGLTGGTITSSGTISINSTYQTYISNGNTAYGWGNHANVGYLTSQSNIGFSQLPTMYWANVQVSSTSSDTTEPKMKSLHLYGSSTYGVGGKLKFGDGDYVYLAEESDDKLTIYGKSGIYMKGGTSFKVGIGTTSPAKVLDVVGDINATLDITTAQAVNARNIELSFTTPYIDFHHGSSSADFTSRLITTDYGVLSLQSKTNAGVDKLSGFVVGYGYDGSYIQIGSIRLVYDSTNYALKVVGSDGSSAANFYATGGVSALGQSSGSSSAYYANLAVGTQLDVSGRAYFNDDIYVNVGGSDYVLDGNRCVELGILS